MEKQKEKVLLPKDAEHTHQILSGAKDKEWECIENETNGVDLEKGFEEKRVVLKRKSDGKYYRFFYNEGTQHSLDDIAPANTWPLEGIEVFPTQVTKTVYITHKQKF